MLDICLLGCGGGMPMTNRYLSSALINFKGRKILVDCGEGTQVAMRKVGWGFKSVDIICITHCHGDHIVGLPGLLSTLGNSGRTNPLIIIGPVGITRVVNGLRVICEYLPYDIKIMENISELSFEVSDEGIELKGDNILNRGELYLKTLELDHSSPCIGYSFYIKRRRKFDVSSAIRNNVPKLLWSRLQREEDVVFEGKCYNSSLVLGDERQGIKLSFITDTRPNSLVAEFIKGSNLFICEGTYGSDTDIEKAIRNKHMTFREAATLAKEGNVNRLLLTHFSPSMENPEKYIHNAKDIFHDTIIGEDGLIQSLNFEE